MNTLLVKLNNVGCKVYAYADDIAIVASGKYITTLVEQTNYFLDILSRWCRDHGLSANPNKTEVVLFTRKYKVPEFTPPN